MVFIDSYGLNSRSQEDVEKSYDAAKIWLESKGINVNPTRYQKSRKMALKGGSKNIKEDFDILWACAELHDLCEIHSHLSCIDSAKLIDSLRKSVKGPELLSLEADDGGSIHGRNFTFELYTAARLARAGLEVGFDTDADMKFSIGTNGVHVECKRVISENNMDSLIFDAIKQIDKRCVGSDTDRGVVAVSVSRLVYKAVSQAMKGTAAIIEELQSDMRNNSAKWGQLIQEQFSDKSEKAIGLILHYKMPFRDAKTGASAFLNRFSMIAFNNGLENNAISHALSNMLRNSIEGHS